MLKRLLTIIAVGAFAASVMSTLAQKSAAAPSTAMNAQITQGKYLVTAVAGCMDCHGANLHGAALPFGPIVKLPPGMHWTKYAPNIVALIGSGSAAKWARFFETGLDPYGRHANLPMPQFRMKPSDAHAVIAYIRSLR